MTAALIDEDYGFPPGTQLSLLEEEQSEWTGSDDWETPNPAAQYMADLLTPSDRLIVEPAAGTGQIVRAIELPSSNITAIELNPSRYARLTQIERPNLTCLQSDFLGCVPCKASVVIANPPFSLGMEFIEHSLKFLDRNYPKARLIFLLPAAFFQSVDRGRWFKRLDCRIYQRHSIVGRVAFLQNGVPRKGRQCEDCIFDIRPGRQGSSAPEKFVEL